MQTVFLVIGLTVLAAIAINLVLLALHRPGKVTEFQYFTRFLNSARNPWKAEDDKLAELSKRVEALHEESDEPVES